jgi:hypothetical protein
VAYTCIFVPATSVGGASGVVDPCVPVSVMLVSAFPVTVKAKVFFTVPLLVPVTVAVIVLGPELTPVTTPVLLTDAFVVDEVHVAVSVTLPVEPLL